MRRLRLFGLVLASTVTLGALLAVVASAAETEAGLLYLAGESGALTFEGSGKTGTLTSAAGTITCTAGKGTAKSTQTEKHVTSGTATITLTGCHEKKGETQVACRTGAVAEEVVVSGTFTLFNALNTAKTELEPGIGATTESILKVKCGAVSIVEFKGTVLGLVVVGSLTADVTSGSLRFTNAGVTCDSENAFCKKSQEKANELLCNFSGIFEKGTIEVEATGSANKMILVDD